MNCHAFSIFFAALFFAAASFGPFAAAEDRAKVNVLVYSDVPNYEFRYLRATLSRDDSIGLHSFLSKDVKLPRHPTYLREFPPDQKSLNEFDVVVLIAPVSALMEDHDRVPARLQEFVHRNGGGLIVVSGEKFSDDDPLLALLPVSPDMRRLVERDPMKVKWINAQLTEAGKSHPAMQLSDSPEETERVWDEMRPAFSFPGRLRAAAAAVVLAVHPTETFAGRNVPLIVTAIEGSGRVMFIGSNRMWHWRQGAAGTKCYERFWLQSTHYVAAKNARR